MCLSVFTCSQGVFKGLLRFEEYAPNIVDYVLFSDDAVGVLQLEIGGSRFVLPKFCEAFKAEAFPRSLRGGRENW